MTKIRIHAREHDDDGGDLVIETANVCAARALENARGTYVRIQFVGRVEEIVYARDPKPILDKLES